MIALLVFVASLSGLVVVVLLGLDWVLPFGLLCFIGPVSLLLGCPFACFYFVFLLLGVCRPRWFSTLLLASLVFFAVFAVMACSCGASSGVVSVLLCSFRYLTP